MRFLSVLILAMLLVGIVAEIGPQAKTTHTSGQTWWVGDAPATFRNITAAVNSENVTDGDIIEVMNKTSGYSENVTVDKSLTIRQYSSYSNVYQTLNGGFKVTAPGVTIQGFIIQNSQQIGINLISSDNFIINDTIQHSPYGIYIANSSAGNTLQNNVITNNVVNFDIQDGTLDHFMQQIDTTNKVDNKPICYLVNAHDENVSFDPSYLVIVNSTDITANNFSQSAVQGVKIAYSSRITISNMRNYDYVSLYETNDSTIEDNTSPYSDSISLTDSCRDMVQNNTIIDESIDLTDSNDSVVANNVLTGGVNSEIYLTASENNVISDNTLNVCGIDLYESNDNSIVGNNISESPVYWLDLYYSNDSQIFHNNFLGQPVSTNYIGGVYVNTSFDNGYEGNYWDNYKSKVPNAAEINGWGIWNTTYPIIPSLPGDRFPLVEPWTTCRPIDATWYANATKTIYQVLITCPNLVRTSTNITTVVPALRNEGYGYFTFNITAATQGYFNVSIPKDRLDYPFKLYINDTLILSSYYQLSQTRDSSIIYYQYAAGAFYRVRIEGYKLGNICGDVNGDGVVNMRDIAICVANFNKRG